MARNRSSWCIGLCALLLLAPHVAGAQAAAGNKAAAEALFEEGRTLMQKKQYEQACGKLEASQNLDAGLGTLMLLSDCYEKTGKTASAWATFREAAAKARAQGDQDRENVARARADALAPNLAKLVVRGPESTMQIEGLQVKMNGQPVAKAQWGTLIPVDPGEVSFEVSAPGYKPWSLTALVVEGPSETSIDIPELQPLESESAASESVAEVQTTNTADAALASDVAVDAPGSNNLQTVGLALGIGGLVGVGVGSYFGLSAKSKNDDSKEHCVSDNLCRAEGVSLREDAQSAATTSTIAFGVGGALLVAGGILYFASDESGSAKSKNKELRWFSGVQPGGVRLGLEGTW